MISTSSIREAFYDFILKYVSPKVNENNIIYGNQNNMTLPQSSNDYIIFWVTDNIRHGTNIDTSITDTEQTKIESCDEIVIQIDCYCNSNDGNDDSTAMLRAKSLEILLRDGVASRFFKHYKIGVMYADDARNTTVTTDSMTLVNRWTVTAHVTVPTEYITDIEMFDHLDIGIKDIDVFY